MAPDSAGQPRGSQQAAPEARASPPTRLDGLRRGWLDPPGASESDLKVRTLTNLYNERPAWLRDIHARLDAAVLDAYGWPADITTDDILASLLALNLERAAEEATNCSAGTESDRRRQPNPGRRLHPLFPLLIKLPLVAVRAY